MYKILHIPSGSFIKSNAYEILEFYYPNTIYKKLQINTAPVSFPTEQFAKNMINKILCSIPDALECEFTIIED